MIAIVPTRRGIPTSANSKKPNAPTPASFAASETITLTGDPVSASSDPAWAPNASGMRSWEDGRPSRTERTTTTGRSAATEPLTEMSAVRKATSRSISTIRRVRLSPTRAISSCPAHAVTPEASSASLTTNSVAMKITVGSPKPATDWSKPSTPVAQRESATPIATIATGTRSRMNTATVAASTRYVIVMVLMPDLSCPPARGHARSAAQASLIEPRIRAAPLSCVTIPASASAP